jgi:transcriptional regulator with XRE-family HTH domain
MTMASASYAGNLTADQVRSARAWLAWSQKELAERAGVAVSTVADFERGQRKPIPANAESLRAALEAGGASFHVDGSVSGPLPPAAQRPKRAAGMPLRWIDEQDLATWAGQYNSSFDLPELISKLVIASLGHEVRPRFPSAEGVRSRGWDGTTRTEAVHPWVPTGEAGWELTVQREAIAAKATEDYAKRTRAPDVDDPTQATFVFVSLRRWPGKDRWARERKKRGPWRDVRAYDAVDLVHWIEQAPAVGLWLASKLEKRTPDVHELDAFWDEWSHATKWPLTPALVLCDRDEDSVAVQRWLRGEPAALALQATSSDEVVAFLHATLTQLPEPLRAVYRTRCLVATSEESARQLGRGPAPLYVVMTQPDAGVAARLVKQSHYVLLAYGERPESHGDVRVLARPSREGIAEALVAADLDLAEASARRYARDCARNLTVLRRLIPAHAGSTPRWAEAPPRALLAALLAGSWDASVAADRDCLVELAAAGSYAEVEDALMRFVGSFDQCGFGSLDRPIKKVGSIWRVASIYDAWHLLAGNLTRDHLDRFAKVAHEVFLSRDPRIDLEPGERWMAAVRGVQPPHSPTLRHGLGLVLIALALWGDRAHAVPDAPHRAEAIVEGVFRGADRARWWSLSRDFRLLAEAAPDAFLSAIEDSLRQTEPPIVALLETHDGGLFGAEYLSNLLWALEMLAWSPRWLLRVTHILARLDTLDTKPGRHANRPMNSLRAIYVLWHPQTHATLAERLQVLDSLRKAEPDAAWKALLMLILSRHGEIATPTASPRWRDDEHDTPEVATRARVRKGVVQISEWLVEDAGGSATRWPALLDRLGDLAPAARQKAVADLALVEPRMTQPADRMEMWKALRHELHHHRKFPDAEWSLKADVLDPLDVVYRRFAPDDPLQRIAWLFEEGVELPEPSGDGWRANERAVDTARRGEARALLDARGTAAVLALAATLETAGYLGKALHDAGLGEAELQELLEASLPSDDRRVRNLAHGLIVSAFRDRKQVWAESLIARAKDHGWGDGALLTILRALPMGGWTWQHVAEAGASIDEAYWKLAPHYWTSDDPSEVVFAIRKLIVVGRARHALALAHSRNAALSTELLVEVLTQASQQPFGRSEDGNESTMFQYHVEEILRTLDGRDDVALTVVAGLEWKYMALLEHSRRPPVVLPRALAEDPQLFMSLVSAAFRPSAESGIVDVPAPDPEQASLRAEQSARLLEIWRVLPGTRHDATIDPKALESWIEKARTLARQARRTEVADIRIGNVLSASPLGKDGHWPAEAVREALDRFDSEDIVSGFVIGRRNRRGATMRGLRDGGEQERQEAAKYRAWAKAIRSKHRYTARALDSIAESYEHDAKRHDQRAEAVDDEY